MESTWAVAAQYCPSELGLKFEYSAHSSSKQITGDKYQSERATVGATHTQSDADANCPYCNLGSMKSLVTIASLACATSETRIFTSISHSYSEITQLHPERPNWLPTAKFSGIASSIYP